MEKKRKRDIGALLRDHERIGKAMRAAVRKDLLRHVAEGLPIAVWENGSVVWIPPEEIAERLGEAGENNHCR